MVVHEKRRITAHDIARAARIRVLDGGPGLMRLPIHEARIRVPGCLYMYNK